MAYDPSQQVPPPQGYPPQQNYLPQQGYPPPGYQQPAPAQSVVAQQLGPSSIGIEANIAAAISYFWLIGLIFFFIEKRNKFVRFHALQSLLYGLALFVVAVVFDFIPHVFFVGSLLHLAWLIGAIYAAVQAYNGKWFKLPVVGDIAYNNAMAWNPVGGAPMAGPGMANTQYPPPGQYPGQQPPQYPGQ